MTPSSTVLIISRMIKSINIPQGTPFERQILNGLSKINFIFGHNGSGKTTISKIIAKPLNGSLEWDSGNPLKTLVYNKNFIDNNFYESSNLKGIFTLGEENSQALRDIKKNEDEVEKLNGEISNLNSQLTKEGDGLGYRLLKVKIYFEDKCWEEKDKLGSSFDKVFVGYHGSKTKFMEKILEQESQEDSDSFDLLEKKELESQVNELFNSQLTSEEKIPSIDFSNLERHQSNPILKKSILGKVGLDVSSMITKLNNSDWVHQGLRFYNENDGKCPFCQQEIKEAIAESLNAYFDENFEQDNQAVDNLLEDYEKNSNTMLENIDVIINGGSRFLDIENLRQAKAGLAAKIKLNIQRLGEKKTNLSQSIALESITENKNTLESLITSANESIEVNNQRVDNLTQERKDFMGKVWRYLLEELKSDLINYGQDKKNLEANIETVNNEIIEKKQKRVDEEGKITELERKLGGSVKPTLEAMNRMIKKSGFDNFSLDMAEEGNKNFYQLIRNDGTPAKETLSEGEKSFVAFLYFYYLIDGSHLENEAPKDKIIVFDDPVSSLDSNTLFFVSCSIKDVIKKVRCNKENIKQIFILTHNIYFHKEVTYESRRNSNQRLQDESFFIIRKENTGNSSIEPRDKNPVSTSYELLWSEVKNENSSNVNIENTCRRILEHYFKILGSISNDNITNEFQGNEKKICASLFSWANAGSHEIFDDIYISVDANINLYLKVFKQIFEKLGHKAHYDMMMGSDDSN